jgi:hypothetical protein
VRLSIWYASCLLIARPVLGGNLAQDAAQHGDIEVGVVLDAGEQSGRASATVRIDADREVVWSLITSCREALAMVPGLVSCDVLDTAPDQRSQRIRQVMSYSWYVPTVTYDILATYEKPARLSMERISGDLSVLKVSWTLQKDGNATIARYSVELAPGFWVPHWIVRGVLRRDLPKMLRALRSRAESLQHP